MTMADYFDQAEEIVSQAVSRASGGPLKVLFLLVGFGVVGAGVHAYQEQASWETNCRAHGNTVTEVADSTYLCSAPDGRVLDVK